MNTLVQKYAPPAVVLGAALFWGWPPSKPLDLGEDVVKARAVRWKAADLESPRVVSAAVDPFRPVLVNKKKTEQVKEKQVLEPIGPTKANIRAVVRLTGIAKVGGRSWAIVNGKPRLAGDTLKIHDDLVKSCRVMSIHDDHILVRCNTKFVEIRPQVSGARPTNSAPQASPQGALIPQTTGDAPPPPDFELPTQAST